MLLQDIRRMYEINALLDIALNKIDEGFTTSAKLRIMQAKEKLEVDLFMNQLSSETMCPIEEVNDIISRL